MVEHCPPSTDMFEYLIALILGAEASISTVTKRVVVGRGVALVFEHPDLGNHLITLIHEGDGGGS